MSEPPLTRQRSKASPAKVKAHNHQLLESIFSDLETHSKELAEHSKKAAKLAETVRTVKTTVKVAGRTLPNSTHYTQTITKKSDKPFEKT
jgi:septal ring factor EnvC (AmiA/AmiB activator)